jgi:hypothetical protein
MANGGGDFEAEESNLSRLEKGKPQNKLFKPTQSVCSGQRFI